MGALIEDHVPVVKYHGLNTDKNVALGGTLTVTGAVTLSNATLTGTPTISGAITPTGGVAAAGGFTASPRNYHVGGTSAIIAADGNDSTPATTETYIGEVFVATNCTVTGVAIFNGSVATNGNAMVGLANSSGAVVATSVSTALSGTDAYQRIAFTGTYAAKGPATYYVLTQYNNTGDRYNSFHTGSFGAAKKTGDTFGTFTTITAATTFTADLATMASLY